MLESVSIRDVGVIARADIEFAPGLTVVTGETGAGKTMVLTSIGLLTGARAGATAVRAGAAKAVCEGVFVVPAGSVSAQRVRDAGGATEPAGEGLGDVEVLVARSVTASGRSRAHCGGAQTPAGVLTEVTEPLITVHGQTDQLLLKSASRQRDLVDSCGGKPVARAMAAYRVAYVAWQDAVVELARVRETAQHKADRLDLLRMGLTRIEKVEPVAGEEDSLRSEIMRLGSVEDVRGAAMFAHDSLTAGEDDGASVVARIAAAADALEGITEADSPEQVVAGAVEQLRSAQYLVDEVNADVAAFARDVEADPERLGMAQERLAALGSLWPQYGATSAEVLAWRAQAEQQVADLDASPERVAALAAACAEREAECWQTAKALHTAREKAGKALAKAVNGELTQLAMPKARMLVQVTAGETLLRHGADEVCLLLAPHSGSEAVPIAKGASGGELSRVMLAVEVASAGASGGGTFVFDEVDAGVGGEAATAVGRRLAHLARRAQVIVVTHLPQVAAFGDRHLVVRKDDDGVVTTTSVVTVAGSDRVEELARMLAGRADSVSAREHAEELLAHAR